MRAMIRRGVFPLFLVLALAACNGGTEEAQPTPTPSPAVAQPSPTPEPTPEPTPTPEPAVQRIAYIGTDLDVWIINADGSGQQKLFDIETEPSDSVSNLQWSPDGSKFAVTKSPSGSDSEGVVYIVGAEGETILEVPAVAFLAWSSRGHAFAITRRAELGMEPTVSVLDLEGNPASEPSDGFAASSFAADGLRYAYQETVEAFGICGTIRGVIADLRTREVKPIDPDEEPTQCGIGAPIFSPINSSLLAYGGRLFDLNTGEERSLPGVAVRWSPDGQRLLLVLETCQRAQVYDVERASSVLEFDIRLLAVDAPCWALMGHQSAWSQDSRLLAISDSILYPDKPGILHVRDITTGDDKTIPIPEDVSKLGAFRLRFSPDGQRLLFLARLPGDVAGTWLVGSDGSNFTPLPEGREPAWQPLP